MPSEKLPKDFYVRIYRRTAEESALLAGAFPYFLLLPPATIWYQFPFQIFGIFTTWGAFSFPFIFLATDLTVRIFGAPLARRIIFWVMFPALLLSYVFSVLFHDGNWTGWASLAEFNTFVGRIALASFSAYALGQILDIFVFNRLRRLKSWWIAPTASTVVGTLWTRWCFSPLPFMRATMNLWRQTGRASHLSIICSNSPSAHSSSCLPTASY